MIKKLAIPSLHHSGRFPGKGLRVDSCDVHLAVSFLSARTFCRAEWHITRLTLCLELNGHLLFAFLDRGTNERRSTACD